MMISARQYLKKHFEPFKDEHHVVIPFLIIGIVLCQKVIPILFPDISTLVSFLFSSSEGLSLVSLAFIGNILEKPDRYTAANQIAYKIWLIEVSQIDESQTFPSPNINREMGTIPLNIGEFMHYFEAIDNTLKDNSTGEKTELTTDVTNTFSLVMGGDGVKLYDFIQQYAGGRFIIIYQVVSTREYYIQGTDRKPMILQGLDRKRDNEATAVTFNFQNNAFQQPRTYVGAILRTTPQVIAAGTTTLSIVSGKNQYQLSDHTSLVTIASISGVTSSMYGKTIEVLGSGVSNPPMIEDNGTFILIDGATWSGDDGARIIFRIHDDSTLVEIPGTREGGSAHPPGGATADSISVTVDDTTITVDTI